MQRIPIGSSTLIRFRCLQKTEKNKPRIFASSKAHRMCIKTISGFGHRSFPGWGQHAVFSRGLVGQAGFDMVAVQSSKACLGSFRLGKGMIFRMLWGGFNPDFGWFWPVWR